MGATVCYIIMIEDAVNPSNSALTAMLDSAQKSIEFSVGNMELEESVARHQGHLIKFTNVPS